MSVEDGRPRGTYCERVGSNITVFWNIEEPAIRARYRRDAVSWKRQQSSGALSRDYSYHAAFLVHDGAESVTQVVRGKGRDTHALAMGRGFARVDGCLQRIANGPP